MLDPTSTCWFRPDCTSGCLPAQHKREWLGGRTATVPPGTREGEQPMGPPGTREGPAQQHKPPQLAQQQQQQQQQSSSGSSKAMGRPSVKRQLSLSAHDCASNSSNNLYSVLGVPLYSVRAGGRGRAHCVSSRAPCFSACPCTSPLPSPHVTAGHPGLHPHGVQAASKGAWV